MAQLSDKSGPPIGDTLEVLRDSMYWLCISLVQHRL